MTNNQRLLAKKFRLKQYISYPSNFFSDFIYLNQEPLLLNLVRSLLEAELQLALERPSPELIILPSRN